MSERKRFYRRYSPEFISKVISSRLPHRFVGPDLPESTLRGWLQRFRNQRNVARDRARYSPYLRRIEKLKCEVADRGQRLDVALRLIRMLVRRLGEEKVLLLFGREKVKAAIRFAFNDRSARKKLIASVRPKSGGREAPKRGSGRGLTADEIKTMRRYLTSYRFRRFGVRTLARLAQRNGDLHCTEQTWYRYRDSLGIKREFRVPRPKYPSRRGIRASRVNEIWHVDVSAWRLRASGELAWVAFVVDNFSRAILSYSVEVSRSGVAIIGVLDAAEVFARQSTRSGQIRDVIILCDHGSENRSKLVQSYISERPGWRMVFAQRDIRSSNACVEGVFRLLKQRSLRRRNPSTLRAVRQAVGRFVNEYNLEIPHNALKGALPIEVYKGDSPDSHWRRAKALRREAQRSRGEIDSGGVITRTAS